MGYVLMFISVAVLTPVNHHQDFQSEFACLRAMVLVQEATLPQYEAIGVKPPVLLCVPKGQPE